jgi:hypothetical protein
MRHRTTAGENLYSAESQIHYNEKQLAVFAYMLDFDPKDLDLMDIEEVVARLGSMWKYSSDIRNGREPIYTSNAMPRFFAKMNTALKDRARRAAWNHSLAKAAKNG